MTDAIESELNMTSTRDILALAVETGDALLRNGAEVYRVEDTLIHILEAYQVREYDIYVLSNGIFASAHEDRDDACSMVRHVPLGATHLGRIIALNQLSREICSHECSIADAWERLEKCKAIPVAKKPVRLLCCGLGCACYAFLFGGSAADAAAAFVIGLLLQFILDAVNSTGTSKFLTNILGSALVTLIALLVYAAGRISGLPLHYGNIIIGDIMPLVPGVAITTSIRDFFNGDYLSGAIHMIDALLIAFCIAVGVGSVIIICRWLTGGMFP